jgi:ABC-type bacteriocin/lantibiotic exporter with double-glycine peptidase domain
MIEVDKSENFLPQLAILLILSFRFLPAFNGINASLTYLKIFQPSVYLIYNKKLELNFYLENNFKNIKNVNQIFDKSLDKKEISLKNVSYRYPDQKEYILKNLNIEINRGEKIGISGKTGCGKSTLLYLMMGLIKPSEGKIFYNGKDNCNDEIKLSEKISYVPQIPFLHDTSIKKNIVFDFSEEENLNSLEIKKIEELVKLTLLDDKVRALPEGLDSKVGDNAVKLSGGEKQRVAIARSLYKNFDLLFLDEFTSSLDSITEEKIIQNLINKYSEKTMIIISHKSKTLQMCDRIINLDKKNDN